MEQDNTTTASVASKKNIEMFFNTAFVVLFGIMFILAANFLVVSLGGNGLQLPPNNAVWASLAVLILLSIYKILLTDKIIISKLLLPVFIMCCLLVLPGLVHANVDTRQLVLRIAQVVGFFLVFFSISQYRLPQKKQTLVFYLILFAALVQIIYVLAQKYHNPETTPAFLMLYLGVEKPPVGGFLQVNALSIFLVTSVLIVFYVSARKSFNDASFLIKLLILIVLIGAGFVLAIISSRAALLALGLAVPLMLVSTWQRINKKWLGLLLPTLITGIVLGFVVDTGANRLEHKKMTSRLLAWSLSVDAIKEQPLLGHGLGGFTKAFFDQYEKHNRQNTDKKPNTQIAFFTHPHNEVLYWGVESGMLAILGIVGFFIYYFRGLFKTYAIRDSLQYLALLLPIGLSTQVSLPFYLSTLLMVLFVFLLLLPFSKYTNEKVIVMSDLFKKTLIILFGVGFVFYLWFIKQSITGGITITRYVKIENSPYQLVQKEIKNPYWGKVAINYAHQFVMNGLLNQGNIVEARKHLRWFEDQLKVEEEPMYYEVLLNTYPLLGEKQGYEQLRNKVINRYPSRFNQYPEKLKIIKKKPIND